MTNRRIAEAADGYCSAVRRMLACVTKATFIVVGGRQSPTSPHTMSTPKGSALLQTKVFSAPNLTLEFSHSFRVIPDPNERAWQPTVTEYTYTFGFEGEAGQEFLAYHWHPDPRQKVRYPHIHLEAGASAGIVQLQKAHIPTGRIDIPALIVFAIESLGVKPLREDWTAVLEQLSDSRLGYN